MAGGGEQESTRLSGSHGSVPEGTAGRPPGDGAEKRRDSGKPPGSSWLREIGARPGGAVVTWPAKVSSTEAGGLGSSDQALSDVELDF